MERYNDTGNGKSCWRGRQRGEIMAYVAGRETHITMQEDDQSQQKSGKGFWRLTC